jgi:hypothetical protein
MDLNEFIKLLEKNNCCFKSDLGDGDDKQIYIWFPDSDNVLPRIKGISISLGAIKFMSIIEIEKYFEEEGLYLKE